MKIDSFENVLREMGAIAEAILNHLPTSPVEREETCRRAVQLVYAALASALPEDYREINIQEETTK